MGSDKTGSSGNHYRLFKWIHHLLFENLQTRKLENLLSNFEIN